MITLPTLPLPTLGRMMAFIDGENLVAGFQGMMSAGSKPHDEVKKSWLKDSFVWNPNSLWPGLNVILRATYYTYVQGSDQTIADVETAIKGSRFRNYHVTGSNVGSQLPSNLSPCVFWKEKNRAGKGVDIKMTVDILTHSYQDNLDIAFLVTGDGDYLPIIEEVQRLGKQVFISALSRGLSPALRTKADYFDVLDSQYFLQPKPTQAAQSPSEA